MGFTPGRVCLGLQPVSHKVDQIVSAVCEISKQLLHVNNRKKMEKNFLQASALLKRKLKDQTIQFSSMGATAMKPQGKRTNVPIP